jgi:SAM-dependent methyltransferase
MLPVRWEPGEALHQWAQEETNCVLRSSEEIEFAAQTLLSIGLPLHSDRAKNWDNLIAILQVLRSTSLQTPVLDAGSELYSKFLPGLRRLGYVDLTGINIAFQNQGRIDDIFYRPGDITASDLPSSYFGFISCLSVVEHGVNLLEFFKEQARLLRENGRLFVSTDYWPSMVDTKGLRAYGVPIRIFDQPSIKSMIQLAANFGLVLDKEMDLTAHQRVVHWGEFGLRYTFVNLLWRKCS